MPYCIGSFRRELVCHDSYTARNYSTGSCHSILILVGDLAIGAEAFCYFAVMLDCLVRWVGNGVRSCSFGIGCSI
jgi:hypothetical protein